MRREPGPTTHLACADGLDIVIDSLLDICPSLDDELAQVVIEAIAERHYRQVRTKLQVLVRDKVSSPLRDYLVELLRSRDRYGLWEQVRRAGYGRTQPSFLRPESLILF